MQRASSAAYAVLNDHLEGRDWIVGDGYHQTADPHRCCGYLYYPESFGIVPGCPMSTRAYASERNTGLESTLRPDAPASPADRAWTKGRHHMTRSIYLRRPAHPRGKGRKDGALHELHLAAPILR